MPRMSERLPGGSGEPGRIENAELQDGPGQGRA